MSQFLTEGVELGTIDPYEIGWYIESADEDIYGPVSRKSLRQFLRDGTITPNTLVRHCTQPETRPAADQPEIMDQLELDSVSTTIGDRLADAWPRKTKDRLALAADSLPCARHKQPAILFCVRCHAPYCTKCRAKPFKKQFFFCKVCQSSLYNRRVGAYFVDVALYVYGVLFAIYFVVALAAGFSGMTEQTAAILNLAATIPVTLLLFFRDALTRGASVGKRMVGLRVVQTKDGTTPLTYGQGAIRWLSQLIPFFNILDIMVPFRDPLTRRYGDRWAGTRVIDSVKKLAKARAKMVKLLFKKGIQPPPPREMGLTMEEFARLV